MKVGFKTPFIAALGILACVAVTAAAAQTWPVKPVRIVIPFTPGGGSDSVGRILAQKLGELTGQGFVVENRPGAVIDRNNHGSLTKWCRSSLNGLCPSRT